MDTGLMLRRRHRQQPGEEEDPELHEGGDSADQDLQLVGQELVPVAANVELSLDVVREEQVYESPPPRPATFQARQLVLPQLPLPLPELPRTAPRALCPGDGGRQEPLFTQEQIEKMEALRRSSPLLMARRSIEDVGRQVADEGASEEARGSREVARVNGNAQHFAIGSDSPRELEELTADLAWKRQMSLNMQELTQMLREQREENRVLREELLQARLEIEAGKFHTPEESKVLRGASNERAAGPPSPRGLHRGGAPQPPDTGLPHQSSSAPTASQGDKEDPKMEFMMTMLRTMQELQKRVLEREDSSAANGVELVRTGVVDLPTLGEWDPSEGPLRMGGWLAMPQPCIADLSTTSEMWWEQVMTEVDLWYQGHIKMAPLARAAHEPLPPPSLQQKQWQRLERRVSSLLLRAVPEQQREELVQSKRLSVFAIMCHLQLTYQPGGLGEKQTLIQNLEDPPEAQSLQEAVSGLRRWQRWRQRSAELGISEPDASVLVRSLTKITGKILESHKELGFRIALARSQLMVDTAPNKQVVSHFATHLLAETEQVAHLERKASPKPKVETKPKRPVEDEVKNHVKLDPKAKELRPEVPGEKTRPCKFFLTDDGCRQGRRCKWAHVKDEKDTKKRCFTRGSTKHFSTACPTNGGDEPQAKVKNIKEEQDASLSHSSREAPRSSTPSEKEGNETKDMRDLLEEANKMLKILNKDPQERPPDPLEELQRQLNDLRKKSMKVFRLTQMRTETSDFALLDSGATHPLRSLESTDKLEGLQKVWVSLADGNRTPMLMSVAGVMISVDQQVEPIVPVGWMARMGCNVQWKGEELRIEHPRRGLLPVEVRDGSPHVPRAVALDLIREYEMKDSLLRKLAADAHGLQEKVDAELDWLRALVEKHPVLQDLPDHIKGELVLRPGEWKDVPANRHRRKKLKRGCIVHLYAGPVEGFTLEKAFKERGLSGVVLEIDELRGPAHNMLGASPTYAGLLRMALDGCIKGLVGGPNCRSRSVLRHYPPGPRPLRAWGGEEHGRRDLSAEELTVVHHDDVLLWRMVFLGIVADFMAKQTDERVIFGLEQPAEPRYLGEVVSFWATREWTNLKALMSWHETEFAQGDFVDYPQDVPIKPTTFGGNVHLRLPPKRNPLARARDPTSKVNSKDLARWVPGLMRALAAALDEQALRRSDVQLKALTWAQHCEAGHVPFRRDCRVCQEASAKGKQHRRIKHPLCGVLSLDTAGPFPVAHENGVAREPGEDMKFLLVGAFT